MAPRNRFAVAVVLLALLTSHSIGEPYLVGLGQDISVRDELVQGWALVENLCPDGTGGCGKRSCCPIGSYCDTNEATNSNLCCPTRTGCGYDVSKASRCAVTTWVEWFTIKDPICCLPGEIGVQPGPNDYYGYCSSAGSNVASSLLASTILSPSTAGATSQASQSLSSTTPNSSPTTHASISAPSAVSSNSAIVTPTQAVTASSTKASASGSAVSTAAANTNAIGYGGPNSLFGIVGGIIGYLAI